MRERNEILSDLVNFKGNLDNLQNELSQYDWDIEKPLIVLTKGHFLSVLEKSINNNLTLEVIEGWANLIECREDIEFENEKIKEGILELANPELYGKPTEERLKELLIELFQ